MKKIVCSSALALVLALGGCSDGMKKTFGLEANPPDAFDVATQAPLSLPPDLGLLPTPSPGQPRPQPDDAAQAGLEAISPESALAQAPAGSSPGEQSLLNQAGPAPPAGIRAQVNQEAVSGASPAPTVDAAGEAQRLRQDAATGQPVTAGETPQQDNTPPNFLQRILGIF